MPIKRTDNWTANPDMEVSAQDIVDKDDGKRSKRKVLYDMKLGAIDGVHVKPGFVVKLVAPALAGLKYLYNTCSSGIDPHKK